MVVGSSPTLPTITNKINKKIMESNISLDDIFIAKSANETIKCSKEKKNPKKFWDSFWFENEVCCLYADSNLGKSILAVQIGNHVASLLEKGETVLYYDFELSEKQFGLRYTDTSTNSEFKFNDNFIRVELDGDNVKNVCKEKNLDFCDVIMKGIENNIKKYNSKAIIVDNISWLVNMKLTGTIASTLMMNLCTLKKKYGLSILVLAHTPKRNIGKPITQNNLSGSKAFTNFFDSMFAIGRSLNDETLKYVKQIKVRNGEFKYGESHVQVCKIVKENSFLGFKSCGFADEKVLLSPKFTATNSSATRKSATKRVYVKKKSSRRLASIQSTSRMSSYIDEMIRKENEAIKGI